MIAHRYRTAWALVLMLSSWGCDKILPGQKAAGTFSVHFSWGAAKPDNFQGWVAMRLEQRLQDPNIAGKVLATAGPELFAPGAGLHFTEVPNGDHLVVIVELRDTASSDARVLYYGLSAPFTLEAGKDTQVGVLLNVTATPAAAIASAINPTGSSIVSIVAPGGAQVVNDPNVTLQLYSNTGVQARVSNDITFPAGATTQVALKKLTALRDSPTGFSGYSLPWNLSSGISAPCTAARGCVYSVYVQLVDADGYSSDTATASITVDTVPPTILPQATVISPPDANGQATILLDLVASEPLGALPVLSIQGQPAPLTLEAQDGNITFSYASNNLAGVLWSDGTYTIDAAIVDAAGNSSSGIAAAAFTVDSTPPTVLAGAQLTAGVIKLGGTLEIAFQTSETLAAPPSVQVGTVQVTDCTASVTTPTDYTCTHVTTFGEGDGSRNVTVQMLDSANNVNTASLGTVTYDVTAPRLDIYSLNPNLAAANTTVVLTVIANEPLGSVPLLTASPSLPGTDFTYLPSSSTTTFDFSYTSPSSGSDSNNVLTAVLTDLAGNVSDPLPLTTLQLDISLPLITNVMILPPGAGVNRNAFVYPWRVLQVSFSVSKPMAPRVAPNFINYPELAGGAFACTGTPNNNGTGGSDYVCGQQLVTSSSLPSVYAVPIIAIDLYGNTTQNANIVFYVDRTLPTGTLTANPNGVAAQYDVIATYVAAEALAAAPTFTVTLPDSSDGSSLFAAPTLDGYAYTWKHTVNSNDMAGTWTLAVSNIQDAVGNPGADANTTVVVDPILPTLLSSSVTPAIAMSGTVVTITFTASEALAAPTPLLSVAGANLAVTATGTANQYSASYTASSGDDGLKPIQVSLADSLGNSNQVSLPTLLVDTALVPGTYTVTPAVAGTSNTLTVQYVAGEPLAGTPTLQVTLPDSSDGTSLFGVPQVEGLAYTWAHVLAGGDPNGTWTYELTNIQDIAGNASAPLTLTNQVAQAFYLSEASKPSGHVAAARLKQLRMPWGAFQNAGLAGQYLVPADLSATADPNAAFLPEIAFPTSAAEARVYASATGGPALGCSKRTANGWGPVGLLADTNALWLAAVNTDGEESPRIRIANTEWIAPLDANSAMRRECASDDASPSVSTQEAPCTPLLRIDLRDLDVPNNASANLGVRGWSHGASHGYPGQSIANLTWSTPAVRRLMRGDRLLYVTAPAADWTDDMMVEARFKTTCPEE